MLDASRGEFLVTWRASSLSLHKVSRSEYLSPRSVTPKRKHLQTHVQAVRRLSIVQYIAKQHNVCIPSRTSSSMQSLA